MFDPLFFVTIKHLNNICAIKLYWPSVVISVHLSETRKLLPKSNKNHTSNVLQVWRIISGKVSATLSKHKLIVNKYHLRGTTREVSYNN